jgi:hypothetical protein
MPINTVLLSFQHSKLERSVLNCEGWPANFKRHFVRNGNSSFLLPSKLGASAILGSLLLAETGFWACCWICWDKSWQRFDSVMHWSATAECPLSVGQGLVFVSEVFSVTLGEREPVHDIVVHGPSNRNWLVLVVLVRVLTRSDGWRDGHAIGVDWGIHFHSLRA